MYLDWKKVFIILRLFLFISSILKSFNMVMLVEGEKYGLFFILVNYE